MILFHVIGMTIYDMSALERFSDINSGGIQRIVTQYVFLPLFGATAGISLAAYLMQSQSLNHAAHHLNIDLLQLSRYPNIASPLVRFIVVVFLVLTIVQVVVLFDPAFSKVMLLATLALVGVSIPPLLLYAFPVLVLRNRIKEEKERELGIVFQALEGDDEAIKSGRIRSRVIPPSIADLLTQRMFIESLWEWPIATHVQKLILFGLLPPLTWVIAAVIENTLY